MGTLCRNSNDAMLQAYQDLRGCPSEGRSSLRGYHVKNTSNHVVNLLVVEDGERLQRWAQCGGRQRSLRMGRKALEEFLSSRKHQTQLVRLAPGKKATVSAKSDYVLVYGFACHGRGRYELFTEAEGWEWQVSKKCWEAKPEMVGNANNTWWTDVDPSYAKQIDKDAVEDEEQHQAEKVQPELCSTPTYCSEETETCGESSVNSSSSRPESKYFLGQHVQVYSCSHGQWQSGQVICVRLDGSVRVSYGCDTCKTIPLDMQDKMLKSSAPTQKLQTAFAMALSTNKRVTAAGAEH